MTGHFYPKLADSRGGQPGGLFGRGAEVLTPSPPSRFWRRGPVPSPPQRLPSQARKVASSLPVRATRNRQDSLCRTYKPATGATSSCPPSLQSIIELCAFTTFQYFDHTGWAQSSLSARCAASII